MGSPAVTVVVPNLNQGRFLREAIDSVLAQAGVSLALHIADGGSRDESLAVLRSFGDRLTWESGPDGGQAAAIDRCFRGVRSEFVAWLNADDVWAPGMLRRAVDALRRSPDAAFCYGHGERMDAAGRSLGAFSATRPFDRWRLAHVENYILQPTTLMRRRCVLAAGGVDPSLHWAMDWDLWLRLSARWPVVFVDALQAAAREHARAKTASGGWRRFAELRRVMARHATHRRCPAAWIYGLDTLRKRWPGVFGASSEEDAQALRGRWLPRVTWPVQRGVAALIARQLASERPQTH